MGEANEVRKERLYFIDYLRAAVIFLVVWLHAAMPYTGNDWYINDVVYDHTGALGSLGHIVDIFIMPLMFFAAGYFAPASLLKKGQKAFWRDKLYRIILPWVVGVPLVTAPVVWFLTIYPAGGKQSLPDYIFSGEWYHETVGGAQMHLWFLGMLTLAFAALALVVLIIPQKVRRLACPAKPGWKFWCMLIVVPVVLHTFTNYFWDNFDFLYLPPFCLQPVMFFSLDSVYFALGIIAWRQHWFASGGFYPGNIVLSAIVCVVSSVLLMIYDQNRPDTLLSKIILSVIIVAVCHSYSWFLTAVFYRYLNRPLKFWQNQSANSYSIYIFHMTAVTALNYWLLASDMNVYAKMVVATIAGYILSWAFSQFVIHKLPVLKKIL
ncbi:MAG: acyltransferase family protein [Bacillota bacterium]